MARKASAQTQRAAGAEAGDDPPASLWRKEAKAPRATRPERAARKATSPPGPAARCAAPMTEVTAH